MQRNKSAQFKNRPQQLSGSQISKDRFDQYINQKIQKATPKNQNGFTSQNKQQNLPNIEQNNFSKHNYINNDDYYTQQHKNSIQQPHFSQTTKNSRQIPKPTQFNNNNGNMNNSKRIKSGLNKFNKSSQSGYLRPQSSQSYNKPLIVHVEKQLEEVEVLKNPSIARLKGWDKEDFEKEQQNKLSDKLWDEVYYTKNKINELVQQNNDTRAKIWNIEKENRKMQKQIEQWGLQQGVIFDKDDNAFVDSMTVQKVYKDENFYAVTMKQQLKDLAKELELKQSNIKDYKHRINNFQNEIETVNETLKDSQKAVIINSQKLQDEQKKLMKNEKTLERIKKGIINENENEDSSNEESQIGQFGNKEDYDNNIEDLRFESEELAEQINELKEKNKVIQFEIQIQKKANENSENEKVQLKKKIEQKQKEIQILRQELNQRGINQEYNEFEIKKKREPKQKEKTEDEIIEEKEKRIEDLKKKISVLNFDIQKMTQAKIIDKQDNQKEIEQSQREIYELEEKYLNLVTEYYRVKARNMEDIQYNKSNITYFGSDGDKDSSISEVDSINSNIINLEDEQ